MSRQMMEEKAEGEGSSNPVLNPCPICLGLIIHPSFLDQCFHKYCYTCIVRWTEVVSKKSSLSQPTSSVKCPLCKTDNFSIIYGYDGTTFQRHFINRDADNSTFFSKAHKYRLQCYYTEPGLLKNAFKVDHYWKSRKFLQLNKQLELWLRRELQVLIQEEGVDIIMHHILGVIESFSRSQNMKAAAHAPQLKQEEFKGLVAEAARPFLAAKTERFAEEIELYLASGLTVEAYDNAYKRCLGWKKPDETPENPESSVHDHDSVAPCLYLSDDESYEADWSYDDHL